MRISELARRSGIAVPTIKYYLHEGLLPAGMSTAHNQATYDDTHLRRLRVIRALTDVGGLSVTSARAVLDAITSGVSPHELIVLVIDAATAHHRRRNPDGPRPGAAGHVLDARRWRVRPEAHALGQLNEVCATARLLEFDEFFAALDDYADAVARLAACDTQVVRAVTRRLATDERHGTELLENVAIAAVLGAAAQAALANLAREDALVRLLGNSTR
jgi:DNA-binding transcriptional MerR regulator